MVLVDTSVWINHFRKGDQELMSLLTKGNAAIHEFVIGELACGGFDNLENIIKLLSSLNQTKKITLEEYLVFIRKNQLSGKGLGFVDIHLLASARLTGYLLFTYDKRLLTAAKEFRLSFL